ncbi:hypothetical protein ACHAXS_000110 [Conticribra weissflogii]
MMLELQMKNLHLPKKNLLPNMHTEGLPLVISTIAMWFECSSILLDTHSLTLLMLSTVLQVIFFPKLVHKDTFKKIATSDEGLIMKPSDKLLTVDSFPDADFAGMYGHEAMNDPAFFLELDV